MSNELRVVSKRQGEWPNRRYVYIGRPSVLGNPFPIGEGKTRADVIAMFKAYLHDELASGNEAIINELERIGALVLDGTGQPVCLQCFCSPQACHGDVIKEVIEDAINNNT